MMSAEKSCVSFSVRRIRP